MAYCLPPRPLASVKKHMLPYFFCGCLFMAYCSETITVLTVACDAAMHLDLQAFMTFFFFFPLLLHLFQVRG